MSDLRPAPHQIADLRPSATVHEQERLPTGALVSGNQPLLEQTHQTFQISFCECERGRYATLDGYYASSWSRFGNPPYMSSAENCPPVGVHNSPLGMSKCIQRLWKRATHERLDVPGRNVLWETCFDHQLDDVLVCGDILIPPESAEGIQPPLPGLHRLGSSSCALRSGHPSRCSPRAECHFAGIRARGLTQALPRHTGTPMRKVLLEGVPSALVCWRSRSFQARPPSDAADPPDA
eukprot:138725-Prorocentrum_minimum.AAC.4